MHELDNLDLSVLDQLQDLKARREALQARLSAMDERRGEVAPPVYLRVRADYEQQKHRLIEQETPLKGRAKDLFGRLREALEHLERDFEDSKLNLQELEFRHSLGEFDAAEFAMRKTGIEQSLQERRKHHEQARSIRERFLAVFGSESELLNAQQEAPVRRAPAPPPVIVQPVDEPLPGMSHTTEQVMPVAIPMPPPAPVVAAPPKRANPDATVVFRPGRLSPLNAEAGSTPTMLSLKPISIGSDPTCDVRIVGSEIAHKHVSITLTRSGFMLKDLAGNGVVSVNSQAIEEQLLKDGDALQIGAAKYAFRLS